MRRLSSCLLSLFVILFLNTPAVQAQETETSSYATPESVAVGLSEAYQQSDYERAAALMHPDALRDLQTVLVEVATAEPNFAQVFTGAATAEEVAALDSEEVYVRFINAVLKIQPDVADALGTLNSTVIGTVAEGDTLAHVLTRGTFSISGASVTKMQVLTVRSYDGEWRAELSGDISAFAEILRAQVHSSEE